MLNRGVEGYGGKLKPEDDPKVLADEGDRLMKLCNAYGVEQERLVDKLDDQDAFTVSERADGKKLIKQLEDMQSPLVGATSPGCRTTTPSASSCCPNSSTRAARRRSSRTRSSSPSSRRSSCAEVHHEGLQTPRAGFMTKGSDLLVAALENEGVERIFGIPGEENLDVVESLRTSRIELVITRHEQAAGFMAATYGRLTGKPGVCITTLGPGALNLTTAAAYAHLGAMPMVMITGQKGILASRQARFQIVDWSRR